jgi:hypothetical protein
VDIETANSGDRQMNYRDAQDLAVEFGAKKFRGDHNHPTFPCWADRIAMLPMAAERGYLPEWIKEANQHAE